MTNKTLVQIKGYSFYMEDVILVTPIINHESDYESYSYNAFTIRLISDICIHISDTPDRSTTPGEYCDTLVRLYELLYNRRLVTSTSENKPIEIFDLEMGGISLNIVNKYNYGYEI